MDDRDTSSTKPTAADAPLWSPTEFGLVGLDWFERMLGTWFDIGRAHSSQAVHAARDLSNAATGLMGSAVALSLTPPIRSGEPSSDA